jgi:stearoyl-CoA desaturase (delta-9 desaturase)
LSQSSLAAAAAPALEPQTAPGTAPASPSYPAGAVKPGELQELDADSEPWKWSWFRCAPREWPVFAWVMLIHALSLVGLILFPAPGWGMVGAAYGLFWLGGLGTTVAYHRALAHRSVRLHPIIEMPLIFFAQFNGSGTPATWSANHRLHHAKSDTRGDISSPRLGGFWWSHLRWLWQTPQTPISKWAPDLDRGRYRIFTRFQTPLLAVSLVFGAIWGWAGFFWLGAIRLTFALHAQCVTNSLAHMKKGAQKFGEDSSVNCWWLAPVQALQGENWHGNHHAKPASARLGVKWWQIDLGWWFIVACEMLGLAKNVRRPKFAG